MGVGLGGVAVGGPPGVADAGRHPAGAVLDHLAQVLERPRPGGGPGPPEVAVVLEGHAGRVVAPVLEALQTLEQELEDLVTAGGSDDAAHGAQGYGVVGRRRDVPPGAPPGRPGRPQPARFDHHAQPGRGVRGRLVRGLDHDPDQGLGPAGPQQHPAARRPARPPPRPPRPAPPASTTLGRIGRAATLTSTWGSRCIEPRRPAPPAAARAAGRRSSSRTPVSTPSPVVASSPEDDVARLLAAEGEPVGVERLEDVAVADLGLAHGDAPLGHGQAEPEVRHDRDHHGVAGQPAAAGQVGGEERQQLVAGGERRRCGPRPPAGRRRRRGRGRGPRPRATTSAASGSGWVDPQPSLMLVPSGS